MNTTKMRPEVTVRVQRATLHTGVPQAAAPGRKRQREYLDPMWNQLVQVYIEFQCSFAVARDWHRHRTAFPWNLNIVQEPGPSPIFKFHSAYVPMYDPDDVEDFGGDRVAAMAVSTALFNEFREAGDMEKAMLCIPFGTLVSMRTTMGLRDAVYMLELRANAHGANFEYEAQAKEALRQLKEQLGYLAELLFPEGEE